MDSGIVPALGVVKRLLRSETFAHGVARAVETHSRVLQIGIGGVQIGQRLGDFLRPRAMRGLIELGLQADQLSARLLHIGSILIVLQTHQDLPFLHTVALVHADPANFADHLGGQFDFVSCYDVTRGVEHHAAGRAVGGNGGGALRLDYNGGVDSGSDEFPSPQRHQH